MDVLHMFATAKTGDSHMSRLQSIQCLIVSGLGGTVIVGGRCNTLIVRLAIRKIAITFIYLDDLYQIFHKHGQCSDATHM